MTTTTSTSATTTTSTSPPSCAEGPSPGPPGWTAASGGWSRPLGDGRRVWLRVTDRADGDLHIHGDPAELVNRRARLAAGPWVWLRQVHGDTVVVARAADPERRGGSTVGSGSSVGSGAGGGGVDSAGSGDTPEVTGVGAEADAAVTADVGPVLVAHTADCAPVALWSDAGVVGVAHVGWRGLRAGVLHRTVEAMASLGGVPSGAVLGPCIEAACYAFGTDDLAAVAGEVGPAVVGRTVGGGPALDLVAGVEAQLSHHDVPLDATLWRCTACDPRCYSHRARTDGGRAALLVRLLGPDTPRSR